MTKRDLVVRISNETELVQQDVLKVIQKTLDYISEEVENGRKVELRNFGVFEVKVRKARIGRNPNSPEKDIRIPPRPVVKFKPGKEMRDAVLKLAVAEEPETAKASAAKPKAAAKKAKAPAAKKPAKKPAKSK
jgi:nucleoid DNA-binding protein